MSSTYRIDERSITEHLLELAQRGNQPFTQRLHPDIAGVLGVRLPDLRALARRIVRSGSWPAYLAEAERGERPKEEDFMEARTLQGLVLGMLPVGDFSAYLTHLSRWVRVIHSWSVCDSFSLPQPKKPTSLRSASSRGCTTRPSRRSASRAASIPTPRPYSRLYA